ncbi:type II toxin-antitoxin system RelE/ParE family toxin [Flavobacterium sp. MFBS3-15]|uniref:type II toxin-antitoxin system RelE/ParE family toxin n=1 Tax=Flavobacterium sp. MFBS3-15 TaxID=2989816 RepID=UPI003558C215
MGTRPVEWHPVAIKSLEDIFLFIFEESPQNAAMVYQQLLELAETANLFSEKYPLEKSYFNPSVRFIPKWNYKIVYQILEDKILILKVFPTHQNPKKLSR